MSSKILLIERDPSLRRKWSKFLEFESFEVVSAVDESNAERLITNDLLDIDLIVISVPNSIRDYSSIVERLRTVAPKGRFLLILDDSENQVPSDLPVISRPFYPEHLVLRIKQLINRVSDSGQIYMSA